MDKVILIGDSIRMGYQQTVLHDLHGTAEVTWPDMNGFDTRNVLMMLDEWAITQSPALVHINAGLHDIRRDRQSGEVRVPLAEYRDNVDRILDRLRGEVRAKVIWATMTPVNEQWHREQKPFDRREADVAEYNAAAVEVCKTRGVPVDDLCAFMTLDRVKKYLSADGVHFSDDGYTAMGHEVARVIRNNL